MLIVCSFRLAVSKLVGCVVVFFCSTFSCFLIKLVMLFSDICRHKFIRLLYVGDAMASSCTCLNSYKMCKFISRQNLIQRRYRSLVCHLNAEWQYGRHIILIKLFPICLACQLNVFQTHYLSSPTTNIVFSTILFYYQILVESPIGVMTFVLLMLFIGNHSHTAILYRDDQSNQVIVFRL